MMKKIFITLFISFYCYNGYSQKEVFIDEKSAQISKSIYLQKCSSKALFCLNYKTDSLIVHKIHNRYKFGKINKEEVEQIRLLLAKRSSTKISPEQTIIIKHSDSLGRAYQSYLKYWEKSTHKRNKLLTERQLERKNRSWANRLTKCTSKYQQKGKAKVFYSYKYLVFDKNYIKKLNVIPHQSSIWSAFFAKIQRPNFVIIKPNGEYFLSSSLMPSKALNILVNSKDWNIHKNDLASTKTQYPKKGQGIFRNVVSINQEILSCF